MLIRPKSMATVVEVLRSTPATSSTPTPAWVIVSSVVSGRISLTEPTSVVLPTPKPPTITTLTAMVAESGSRSALGGPSTVSEPLKSMDHRLQQGALGKDSRRDGG